MGSLKGTGVRTRTPVVGRACVLTGLLFAFAATASAHALPPVLRSDRAARLATVRMWADQTAGNAGFNFDGLSTGRLVLTVPVGWRMVIDFRNLAPLPHSLVVEPWNERSDLRHPYAAFRGASTPHPFIGTASHQTQVLRFRVTRPGRYRLACGLPGHRDLGMWDTLIVSASARTASARVWK